MNRINYKPVISIVICTFNGGDKISNCINALAKQLYPKENFKIIVVNDGSSDNTQNVLSEYNVKVINNNINLGLSASRNIGIKHALGEIIAFTDDDCVPDKNWLSEIAKSYVHKKTIAVGGAVIPVNNGKSIIAKYLQAKNPLLPLEMSLLRSNNIIYRFYLYLTNSFIDTKNLNVKREVYSLVGANMSFRKEVLNVVQFDEKFKFGADEEDLFKRIHRTFKSKKIIYNPKVIINHNFELRISALLNRYFKYGEGNARMYFKYTDHNLTFYPFPLMYLLSILLISKYFLILLLPSILYFQWSLKTLKSGKLYYLLFPYIQFVTELFNNLGIAKYYLKTNINKII